MSFQRPIPATAKGDQGKSESVSPGIRVVDPGAKGYAVVMTACIDPTSSGVAIHRADPAVRLTDYQAALRFWLHLDDRRIDRIVFLENSGYPLDALRSLVDKENRLNKQVDFVSMQCNTVPPGVSYGFAELAMLEQGLPQSPAAQSALYWIKATGRLTFPGLPRLLDRLPDEFLFAVDCRDNTRFVRSPQRFVTTQLMIFSQSFFWNEIAGAKDRLTPQRALIENLLFEIVLRYRNDPSAILRWPVNVDPVGLAAHWAKRYDSPKMRAICLLRAACRRVYPNWWV